MLGLPPLCSSSLLPAPVPWSWASTTELPGAPPVKPISDRARGTAQSSALLGKNMVLLFTRAKLSNEHENKPQHEIQASSSTTAEGPKKLSPPHFWGAFGGVSPAKGVGGEHAATRSEMLSWVLQKEGSVPCRNIFELMFVPSPGSGQNVKACSELEIF